MPERQEVDEKEIVRRMRAIYTPQQVRERLAQWALWREQGLEHVVQEDLARLRGRMYDLSQYMKTLKQRYSQMKKGVRSVPGSIPKSWNGCCGKAAG